MSRPQNNRAKSRLTAWLVVVLLTTAVELAHAAILWSDPDPRVVHKTPQGIDVLGNVTQRDDKSFDVLYFKFQVDPLSDVDSEPYSAGLQLFVGDEPHLGIGNAPEAWGYSAFRTSETNTLTSTAGEFDLKSANAEAAGLGTYKPYELPHHKQPRTIVFKIQFVPDGDDLVTVWLNPDLSRGATDENQAEKLTTKFKADATFDQIRLRHAPGPDAIPERIGSGWIFSDMAMATSFNDFIVIPFWQKWWFMGISACGVTGMVAVTVRLVEKRKYQRRLRLAEQERALERERARIAQDLHDDLGSSLTRIALLSDLLRSENQSAQQVQAHAEKITQTAAQTVQALEEIVWAVRPGSDSLQSLVEYIAHFSNEHFEGHTTRCRLNLPHDLPAMPLPPEIRHNIFLVVKEALTNVLKHSGAQEVHVHAKATGNVLEFIVQDDGGGFDPKQTAANNKRNGLTNMQRRAESMGGQLTVDSSPKGTTVRLIVKVSPVTKLKIV